MELLKLKPRPKDIKTYAYSLLKEFESQSIFITIVNENKLTVRGLLTTAQREEIRLWKRQIIDALAPKCQVCTLSMRLLETEKLWFCPFGCSHVEDWINSNGFVIETK